MSDYLFRPTLEPAALERARYYAQGLEPPSDAERQEVALAQMMIAGELTRDEAIQEMVRHAMREPPIDQAASLGRLVAAGHMDYADAIAILRREQHPMREDLDAQEEGALRLDDALRLDAALGDLQGTELRFAKQLDRAVAHSRLAGDYTHTVAEVDRVTDPALAELVGLDLRRSPTQQEVAKLMVAHRTDGAAVPGKHYAIERTYTDPKTGREKTSHPLGFVDLTFAPHKSVSILQALAPTGAEGALIWQAHRAAVEETMLLVEKTIGQVKLGAGGKDGAEQGSVVRIYFDHFTARPTTEDGSPKAKGEAEVPGDMHMHTHTVVPNVVRTASGRVGSLYLNEMDGRVREFGATYQALLARNLRRIGVDVAMDERTGAARATAVPEAAVRHFSRRTELGVKLAEGGAGWDALDESEKVRRRKSAVQDNRLTKVDGDSRERWAAEAAAVGYKPRGVVQLDKPVSELPREERLEFAYRTAVRLLEGELRLRSALNSQDVRVAAARGLVAAGIESAADVDAVVKAVAKRGVIQDGRNTAIIWGTETGPTGRERIKVTTVLHESQELEFVERVTRAAGDRSAALTKSQVDGAVAWAATQGIRHDTPHGKLQRAALDEIGQGGRVAVMIGSAGVGKSKGVLAPLIHAYHQQGREVWGTALAWRQTGDFAAAGVPDERRAPISEFVKHAKSGKLVLNEKSVVAIDEIAKVSSKSMLEILRLRDQHGFSIIGFGDPKQTQAVEAGNVVSLFKRALGDRMPELLSSIRQQDPRQLQAANLLRAGDGHGALRIMREDGLAHLVKGNKDAAIAHIAALWKQRRDAHAGEAGYTLTVSVPTNRDALEVGVAIRELRKANAELGREEKVIQAQGQQADDAYELRIAAGDAVRLFSRVNAAVEASNTWRGQTLGVNGDVLHVVGFTGDGVKLRRKDGTEGAVRWNTLRDKETGRIRLILGYAQVIDPIQGVTSRDHINAAPRGTHTLDGHKGYVGASRQTHWTALVTSESEERQHLSRTRPLGMGPPRIEDVWDGMARNLSKQPEKESALATLERFRDMRRGTTDSFAPGLHRIERRAAEGQPETVRKRVGARQLAQRVARVPEAAVNLARRQKPAFDRLMASVPRAWDAVTQTIGYRQGRGPRIGR